MYQICNIYSLLRKTGQENLSPLSDRLGFSETEHSSVRAHGCFRDLLAVRWCWCLLGDIAFLDMGKFVNFSFDRKIIADG